MRAEVLTESQSDELEVLRNDVLRGEERERQSEKERSQSQPWVHWEWEVTSRPLTDAPLEKLSVMLGWSLPK